MGRFLSTDPMGYKDSMNLYQAFNMNGYNFVDPWGTDIINVFFTIEFDSSQFNLSFDLRTRTQHLSYNNQRPNWVGLQAVARVHGHQLNLFDRLISFEHYLV